MVTQYVCIHCVSLSVRWWSTELELAMYRWLGTPQLTPCACHLRGLSQPTREISRSCLHPAFVHCHFPCLLSHDGYKSQQPLSPRGVTHVRCQSKIFSHCSPNEYALTVIIHFQYLWWLIWTLQQPLSSSNYQRMTLVWVSVSPWSHHNPLQYAVLMVSLYDLIARHSYFTELGHLLTAVQRLHCGRSMLLYH